VSPRYKNHEWSDEGYDAIDYLIDNDPIQSGAWFRRALDVIEREEDGPGASNLLMDWREVAS
jgi:hypothetical protein